MANKEYLATGRRKKASARVILRPGKGKITVNGRELENMFPRKTAQIAINEPFEVTSTSGKYDAHIKVNGGGITGQADAIKLALSRALLCVDEAFRKLLRKADMLTRDARCVERKKVGLRGARRRPQYSKR